MFALTRRLRLHRDVEAYGLSALYQVLVACHLAVFLRWWAAILLAPFVIQLPIYAMGLVVMPRWRNNLTVNSRVLMALMIGVSLWLRTWPAYAFLALVAANALAALTMRRFLLGFAAAAPLALFYGWRVGAAVIVLSHLLIVYATLVPNCQWLGPVITCFETDAKEVWLTIDDGPASDTEAIQAMLARHGVPATFFEIGVNHSKTHPSATFWCLGPRRLADEIGDGAGGDGAGDARHAPGRVGAHGVRPPDTWFRAPVGMKNPFVHPILAKRGMRLIGWTVRGLDTADRGAERVVNRILRGVRPGAIVVLHQGRPHSLRTIEAVVEALQARGYAFVIPHDARLKTKR